MRILSAIAIAVLALCSCTPSIQRVDYESSEDKFKITFPTYHGRDKLVIKPDTGGGFPNSYSSTLNQELDEKSGKPKLCDTCPLYAVAVEPDINPEAPLWDMARCATPANSAPENKSVGSQPAVRVGCLAPDVGEHNVFVTRHNGKLYRLTANRVSRRAAEEFFASFSFTS